MIGTNKTIGYFYCWQLMAKMLWTMNINVEYPFKFSAVLICILYEGLVWTPCNIEKATNDISHQGI